MASIKVRDLVQALRASGAAPIRCKGSHQVWKTTTGGVVVVVVNHMNADASHVVLRNARGAGVTI